jgi:hypothetical protein
VADIDISRYEQVWIQSISMKSVGYFIQN